MGVGNGLQGYFYVKYFPTYAYNVAGSDVGVFLETSKNTISNGGCFFPSLLSGYGIIGCALIFAFVYKYSRFVKEKAKIMGQFYYQFIIAILCFFIAGFQGDFNGEYFTWFVICLPFICNSDMDGGEKSDI